MEGRLAGLCEPFGLRRHVVLGGHAAHSIHTYAEDHADLVVVGSHGRHGWRLLFGSKSNAIVHGTPCHVLAVHIPDDATRLPKKYQHILVAVDLSSESRQVLDVAKSLSDDCGASLSMVHVLDLEEDRELARAGLDALGVDYDVENSFSLYGSTAGEIHHEANELGVDLVVIGTHGKQGLDLITGSSANAVLHGAQCDTLCVRINAT